MWPPFDQIVNPFEKRRSYSSILDDNPASYAWSMLDNNVRAWIPDDACAGEDPCWMQMDLGEERRVTGVVTQSRHDRPHHRVHTYQVVVCGKGRVSLNGKACNEWVSVDSAAVFKGPGQQAGSLSGWTDEKAEVIHHRMPRDPDLLIPSPPPA